MKFALIPALLGCALTAASGSADAAVPLAPTASVHLAVPAMVNGKGPFPFILDTGADATGVYEWFAQAQGLKPGQPEQLEGMTGTTSSPTYRLQSLAVDGRAIKNIVADSYPNRHDAEIQAGVAGNDLMDGTVTVFDFGCRQVEIWPKPVDVRRRLPAQATMIQAGTVREGTQLTLPVQIGQAKGIGVLDTGSSDSRLNTVFARAAGIDPAASSFRDAGLIYGANSKAMPSRKGPIGTVRFAGVEIADAQARVMDLAVFKSFGLADRPAMIIGLDLLQGQRLVYDHSAKQVHFDASKCQR